jgi:hypothetical protein
MADGEQGARPRTVRVHATDTLALWPSAQRLIVNTLTVAALWSGLSDPSGPERRAADGGIGLGPARDAELQV